jgi:hypothetical protein
MLVDPLTRVLRVGAPSALVLIGVAAGGGWLLSGAPGFWGGLLGALVPTVFFGITAGVGVRARQVSVTSMGVLVLTSWLFKIVALVAFLYWLRMQDWFDRPLFFFALLIGTAGLLLLEGWLVTRSPQLYAAPEEPRG